MYYKCHWCLFILDNRSILSVELLCFLTWDAVMETEQFEMGLMQPTTDLKPCLRRLHLGVTALREFLQALETYSRLTHLSSEDHDKIVALRGKLPAIRDLRHLFLLQLRHYNPVIQSRRYLRDIITTNHVLILSLERAIQQSCYEVIISSSPPGGTCFTKFHKRPESAECQRTVPVTSELIDKVL